MKVALISHDVSPGILIFRKNFIKYLISQGHQVYAFAIDYTPETRAEVEAMGATTIDYVLNKSNLNPFKDLYSIWDLFTKLKAIAPDAVLSSFLKPSVYGTIAAKFAGVPRCTLMLEGLGYIYTNTNEGFKIKKYILQLINGLFVSIGCAFADKILFLNSDDLIDLSKKAFLNKKKIRVLGPIGLNLKEYPFSPVDLKKNIRFIFISRLLLEKGIFEYIKAAQIVKKKYPEVEFLLLGQLYPDNPSALTKKELDEILDKNLLIYPGQVSNVQDFIINSHVFVLPSYREGFPRSTQEAMAIGRAVITTDVPGCRETVLNGYNGFIVPPFEPEILALKMLHLVEHPNEINRMGYESHQIAVKQFDSQKINLTLADLVLGEFI